MLRPVNLNFESLPWAEKGCIMLSKGEHKTFRLLLSGVNWAAAAKRERRSVKTLETQRNDALSKLAQVGIRQDRGFVFLYLDLLIRDLIYDPDIKTISNHKKLSDREKEVLILHALGYRTADMIDLLPNKSKSAQLGDEESCAAHTYESHIRNIKRKLGFKIRVDARNTLMLRTALKQGLITLRKLTVANQRRLKDKHPLTGKALS